MSTNYQTNLQRLGIYFDKILDIFYDGIYITDASGNTIFVNKRYEKLMGLKKEELLGHNVLDLEEEGIFNSPLNPLVVKSGKPHTSVQINKAGRKAVINGHPVFDEDGKVAYVVTYVRDVTVLSQLKDEISAQKDLIQKYYQEAQHLRTKHFGQTNIIIKSPKMLKLMDLLRRIAPTDTTVLILGETGVGKDVFVKKIHEFSPRKNEPFFKINCATIPENLIESELFGYDPGAFSGASAKGKPGYFELADKGTLFLDEIGELPLSMQAKLLRVLQDQEVLRIGSTKVKKVDVRFIAATNRNLNLAIKEGLFRSDLYYRLHVATLEIPPLRERIEEIIALIDYFLGKYNTKYKKKIVFTQEAKQLLKNYKWPGNVREMENLIQGLVVTADKEVLQAYDLPGYLLINQDGIQTDPMNIGEKSLNEIISQFEKSVLENALNKHGKVSSLAKMFQVDHSTIFRKLKKYGLI